MNEPKQLSVNQIIKVWDLITGEYEIDLGMQFRIKGGRAIYTDANYSSRNDRVYIGRLDQVYTGKGSFGGWQFKQVGRYVDGDTEIEILKIN